MEATTRTLSAHESKVVLALSENGRSEITRAQIADLLGGKEKTADHVIAALRRKGWLQRASWGAYLLIPPEYGPDALGNSNLLALASHVTDRYYFGFGTAAAHYGMTTQLRNVIYVVTPQRRRARTIGDSRVQIVNQAESKFFGFGDVDVLGYKVVLSDREKTAIDCIDHPELSGGIGEAAMIFANASRRRFDWDKAAEYLERIGAGALARRFGWLADYVGADMPPTVRARVFATAAKSRKTWLGPSLDHIAPRALGYDDTWRLFVNVDPEELHGVAGMARRKSIKQEN